MSGPTNQTGVAAVINEAWNGKKKKPQDFVPKPPFAKKPIK